LSRTDKTRPYSLQISDPTGRRAGKVRHDHWVYVTHTERRPVTWGDLLDEFAGCCECHTRPYAPQAREFYSQLFGEVIPSEELVYAAYFGRFRRTRYNDTLETSPELARALRTLKLRISNYLAVKTLPDPGDEFTRSSVIGERDVTTRRRIQAPCDYHSTNPKYNHKLPGNPWMSPDRKRCVWEASDGAHGGNRGCSCCEPSRSRRGKYHRAKRRRLHVALDATRYGAPLDEVRLSRKIHV
jgi:hypothetical protein